MTFQRPYNITLIPGDGVGPEVVESARRVMDVTGVPFSWDVQRAGLEEFERTGEALPRAVLESLRKNKVALKGPKPSSPS